MAQAQRREPTWAAPDDVAEEALHWTSEHLACRDLGHQWTPADAVHVARLRFYRVLHVCARCDMRRIREMSESGHIYAETREYPDGYLTKGLGRIAGEAKDAVRLAATLRGTVTERRGKAKEEDMPRFGATRNAVEGA